MPRWVQYKAKDRSTWPEHGQLVYAFGIVKTANDVDFLPETAQCIYDKRDNIFEITPNFGEAAFLIDVISWQPLPKPPTKGGMFTKK